MQELVVVESVVPSEARRASDTEDDGTGAGLRPARSPPSSPSPAPERTRPRTPVTPLADRPERSASRRSAGGSRAGAAPRDEDDDMSQMVTQQQDVQAKDDVSCSITPCKKKPGEKAVKCDSGCDVLVHLSCHLASDWVVQWSRTSNKDPFSDKKGPKGMKFDQKVPWCTDCTIKAVELWLTEERNQQYALLNKERLEFAEVLPKPKKKSGKGKK